MNTHTSDLRDGRSVRAERVQSANHDRLLAAARTLLDRNEGVEITAQQIANEAGVSTATVYNHFPGSVTEIFLAIGNAVVDAAVHEVQVVLDTRGPAVAARLLPLHICEGVASLGKGAIEILRARDVAGASFFGREPKPEVVLIGLLQDAAVEGDGDIQAAAKMIAYLVRGAIFSFALHAAEDFQRSTATTAAQLVAVGATATDVCLRVHDLSLPPE